MEAEWWERRSKRAVGRWGRAARGSVARRRLEGRRGTPAHNSVAERHAFATVFGRGLQQRCRRGLVSGQNRERGESPRATAPVNQGPTGGSSSVGSWTRSRAENKPRVDYSKYFRGESSSDDTEEEEEQQQQPVQLVAVKKEVNMEDGQNKHKKQPAAVEIVGKKKSSAVEKVQKKEKSAVVKEVKREVEEEEDQPAVEKVQKKEKSAVVKEVKREVEEEEDQPQLLLQKRLQQHQQDGEDHEDEEEDYVPEEGDDDEDEDEDEDEVEMDESEEEITEVPVHQRQQQLAVVDKAEAEAGANVAVLQKPKQQLVVLSDSDEEEETEVEADGGSDDDDEDVVNTMNFEGFCIFLAQPEKTVNAGVASRTRSRKASRVSPRRSAYCKSHGTFAEPINLDILESESEPEE